MEFKTASLVYQMLLSKVPSTYLSNWRYSSCLWKFCSLPPVLFREKVLCHSCSQSFWRQRFCCSWTTYLEQLTCQSASQESQLHKIQETTENIHVSNGLRCSVTFFDHCTLQILLLTYLFNSMLIVVYCNIVISMVVSLVAQWSRRRLAINGLQVKFLTTT